MPVKPIQLTIDFTGIFISHLSAHIVWAVEVAVRLMSSYHVVVEDVGAGLEVGDGAGDFEDAVVGPRTHVHTFHGVAYEHTLVRTRMAKSYLC